MKNHVIASGVICAPPKFVPKGTSGDVHNFHYTPYQPTTKSVYFFITICGQKGYGNYYGYYFSFSVPKKKRNFVTA